MDDLIFKAKKHEYVTEDGKKLPSVSDIISCLSYFCYGEIDKFILEQAAQRGSKIHELTQFLDEVGITECPYELSGYVQAYAKFLNEHEHRWVLTEEPMRYMDDYAGTIDRFGIVDDVKVLLDIKTNSKLSGKQLTLYETQLNLYRRMLENHDYPVERMYILHLKRDGEYKLIDVEKTDELANMCLFIWKKMHERKRRKSNGRTD